MELSPIIDTHALVISDDPLGYPYDRNAPPFAPGEEGGLTRASALIRALADGAGGLRGAVLVQRGRTHGFDNRLICDLAAADPRLRALVAVDPQGGDAAALLDRPGVCGFRLMETVKGQDATWLAGAAAQVQWALAHTRRAVVDVHAFPWNRALVLSQLDDLRRTYGDARVLLDNLGADPVSPPDAALLRLAQWPGLSLKFSAITFARIAASGLGVADVLAAYIAAFGADRLLWGSDVLPDGVGFVQASAQAAQWLAALPEMDRAALLHDNAARVFGLS
ncbi:MAG: hypothetical protein RIS94_1473 [Pseudomonadota bacterium]